MRFTRVRAAACAAAALVALAAAAWGLAGRASADDAAGLTAGFQKGAADHKAIGPLAFSPSGVLYFGDDQGGAIYGVDLGLKRNLDPAFGNVADLGSRLAAAMGTTPAGIQIRDTVVDPVSNHLFVSVRKLDGTDQNPANPANYALFNIGPSGQVSAVDLAQCPVGKVAIAADPRYGGRGGEPQRLIGDIAYVEGRILVAALSREQFSSNLISVPVRFRNGGVERFATSIYHVSHKKQETASPIQTLTVYREGEREVVMAAYVCTPVVRIHLEDLKPGATVTGVTVAELGSGNRPMDMVAYGKPGEQSLLLNNSSFGIVKVSSKVAMEREAVNEKTTADRGRGGATPYPGIEPVEALKGVRAYAVARGGKLLVVRPAGTDLALECLPLP